MYWSKRSIGSSGATTFILCSLLGLETRLTCRAARRTGDGRTLADDGLPDCERRANFPRNHHQHHHLTYPSLPLSRLVNELVIDSMNWNPNLSLFLSLSLSFVVSLISFGEEFERSLSLMNYLDAAWTGGKASGQSVSSVTYTGYFLHFHSTQ